MSQLRSRCTGPGCRIVKPLTLQGLSGLSSPDSLPRSSFARRQSHEMATLPELLVGECLAGRLEGLGQGALSACQTATASGPPARPPASDRQQRLRVSAQCCILSLKLKVRLYQSLQMRLEDGDCRDPAQAHFPYRELFTELLVSPQADGQVVSF